MQFTRLGQYLAASMISGPKHPLLQVRLGVGTQGTPACEKLPPVGNCDHAPLDPEAIVANVLEGLAVANLRLATNYTVTRIRYVENDTGPEVIYGHMCTKLIEHFHAAGMPEESFQPDVNTVVIDCNAIRSESEFWETYLRLTSPEGAGHFGRNLDAFWDALNGGPGWPGECQLQFSNASRLEEFCGREFLETLKDIAARSITVKVDLS